jgi:acyl carrier protein
MSTDEILLQVKKTIAEVSGVKEERIGDNDSFESLELDSLAQIEVLVELERVFGMEVPEDEEDENVLSEIHTVADAVELVRKNLATPAAA